MDYKALYPWAPPNLLDETSLYTSHELIVILRKSGYHFGKKDDRLNIVPVERMSQYVAMNPWILRVHFFSSMQPFSKKLFCAFL